ncbi:hypothetical protein DU508_19920 [Pedobacter chinensis]|uniref:Uncharacterized protein n=2 Tax=Pedobacter chinensis TaxID=2282421 RepID=A0A369PQE8_9SPHI|nr:hypothetical protein DU508_19920 [Pedobacter chinensis]
MAQACKKDILQPNSSILQSSLSIAEAKQYFDANLKKDDRLEKLISTSAQQNITLTEILGNKQPQWNKAYQKMISLGGAHICIKQIKFNYDAIAPDIINGEDWDSNSCNIGEYFNLDLG